MMMGSFGYFADAGADANADVRMAVNAERETAAAACGPRGAFHVLGRR